MDDLEKKVRHELLHSLYEWGVNGSHSEHVKFRRKVIEEGVAYLSKKSDEAINYQALKREKFPKNCSDAYEHVLRNDNVCGQVYTSRDKLNGNCYLQPYYRLRWRTSGEVKGYKLKAEYQGFSPEQLDPLYRFQFNPIAEEDLFFERWFVCDNDAACDGVLFEAVVACHALKSEPCYNCKFQKALRWNGGGSASWQDMICTNCGATYEIKTKASAEKVESTLERNKIPGGSFSSWCKMKNSKEPDQKMYLVLLPRFSTFNRHNEKGENIICKLINQFIVYYIACFNSLEVVIQGTNTMVVYVAVFPITIAEIANVMPVIYHATFNPNYQSIRLKSSVSLKLSTKAKCFNLPVTGQMGEMGQIAVRVFKQRFSEQTYNRLDDFYFCSDISDDNEEKDEQAETADDVNGIATELEPVEVVPDDWEDMASDSD